MVQERRRARVPEVVEDRPQRHHAIRDMMRLGQEERLTLTVDLIALLVPLA
ncbi:MAG: hypothetical protein WCD20_16425 [Rhodomicrobium sp.]